MIKGPFQTTDQADISRIQKIPNRVTFVFNTEAEALAVTQTDIDAAFVQVDADKVDITKIDEDIKFAVMALRDVIMTKTALVITNAELKTRFEELKGGG